MQPDTGEVKIRGYREGDAPLLAEVFVASVRGVGPRAYSAAQVAAWAAGIPDTTQWAARMRERDVFVAETAGAPVGWIELGRDGHVDMWYALPEFAGRGIGGMLYRELERRAIERKLTRLFTEASRISEPLFAHYGYTLDERETVMRDGIEIDRALMSKIL